MSDRFDVAVVGGGPAGAAAALTLRSHAPRLRVALIEAGDYRQPKAGEVLPALAGPVLDRLGVRAAFDAAGFVPARANAAAWAASERLERHSLFSAASHGWHLDRARFDRLLADAAERAGAQVRRACPVRSAAALAPGWRLNLASGAAVDADQLIWATGRSWRLARPLGARVRVHQERTAYLRSFERSGGDGTTLIEARPEGWWYTADLPGRRRIVACVTDAQSARLHGLGSPEGWHRAMRATEHVAAMLGDEAVESAAMARAAGTVTLNPVCGPGWWAAGDTAFAPDPLSSRGLVSALRSGMFAAYAAADCAAGESERSRARYAALAAADLAGYRTALARHYAEVPHHAEEPFWRRAAAPGTADRAAPAPARHAQQP